MEKFFTTFALLASGVICGWAIHGWRKRQSTTNQQRRMRTSLEQLRGTAESMAEHLEAHRAGIEAFQQQLGDCDTNDLQQMVETIRQFSEFNESMQQELFQAEAMLQSQVEQIVARTEETHLDALTGVANRRCFDLDMQESLNRFADQKTDLTLLMIDVDHFKQLNDRFGHPVGDRVLRLVAGVLKDQFQNRGCVCRYGGDEFSVVISGATCEQLVEVADGVLIAVSQSPMIIDENEIRVTCSVGMAQFMINDDIEAVIGRADAALYQSKNFGRNCVHWHDGQRIRPAIEDRP